MSAEPRSFEPIPGYHFRDPALLDQALTHRSFTQETSEPAEHNERFEFLGDAVLGFLVSEGLMARYPSYSEGQLTKLKAYLVSAANLVDVARQLDLGSYLRLGRGEELSGGRQKKALLVNALEAVIAAVYLDGGLQPSKQFIERAILTPAALEAADENLTIDNFKSALQEFLQGRRMPAPTYQIIRQSGPPHRRTFTVELRVGGLFSTSAEASTKKAAEQETARKALEHFAAEQGETDDDERQSAETEEVEHP